jgi:hypothetical protein
MVDLKYFTKTRIDEQLLQTQTFVDALHRIETTIANPNLSVKFAQTCIESLRNQPIFDLVECQRHIPDIYKHLIAVLEKINIKLDNLIDKWSSFTLGHRKRTSLDVIRFDRALVNGTGDANNVTVDTSNRLIFFFYVKLLHEIAHACLSQLGRQLVVGDFDDRFTSPATHALTGNVGNAIERHFFGSIVDISGRYIDDDKSIYKIDHLILTERVNKKLITSAYLREFMDLNLAKVISISLVKTKILPQTEPSMIPETGMATIVTNETEMTSTTHDIAIATMEDEDMFSSMANGAAVHYTGKRGRRSSARRGRGRPPMRQETRRAPMKQGKKKASMKRGGMRSSSQRRGARWPSTNYYSR